MLILCQKFIQLGVPASHGAGQAHDHDHPWSVILLYGPAGHSWIESEGI